MITHSRIFGRLNVFTCTCRDSHMFRDMNLKVTFVFTIISSIAATTLKLVAKVRNAFFFYILSLKVDLDLNLFSILKTTFKLTQGRMSQIVFSKVDFAESDDFPK